MVHNNKVKRMTTIISMAAMSILASSLFVACGSSSSSTSSAGAAISGAAILGPISGATVTVYPVKSADGTLDTTKALATATTDASGKYTIALNTAPTMPVGVQITGGSYKEEGSGTTVSLGTKTFTTLMPSIAAGASVTAALGPLPDMAFQRFQNQMASGVPAGSTIAQLATNANYAVSQSFGLTDIVGVVPANPYGTIPNDATGQYALVMAALSKAAATAGVDSISMAAAYASNFKSTGVFNPSAVTVIGGDGVSHSVTPPTLASLATTTASIGNGSIPLSGVAPPAGFVPPTMNPIPPSVAPPAYTPGTGANVTPITPGSGTAVSCTLSQVVGSVTHTTTIGSTATTSCTDFVGTSYTLTMLQSMCPSSSCTVSASACGVVNSTGYVGGCRSGASTAGDQVTRYYGGYTSPQAANLCNSTMPACSTGT